MKVSMQIFNSRTKFAGRQQSGSPFRIEQRVLLWRKLVSWLAEFPDLLWMRHVFIHFVVDFFFVCITMFANVDSQNVKLYR